MGHRRTALFRIPRARVGQRIYLQANLTRSKHEDRKRATFEFTVNFAAVLYVFNNEFIFNQT